MGCSAEKNTEQVTWCGIIQLNVSVAVHFSPAPVGTRASLSLCLTPSQNGKQECSARDGMALGLLQPPG